MKGFSDSLNVVGSSHAKALNSIGSRGEPSDNVEMTPFQRVVHHVAIASLFFNKVLLLTVVLLWSLFIPSFRENSTFQEVARGLESHFGQNVDSHKVVCWITFSGSQGNTGDLSAYN